MEITEKDIRRLLSQGEHKTLEMKKCRDSVPNSVWETYSAFANTRGGVILLGVTEDKEKSGDYDKKQQMEMKRPKFCFKSVSAFANENVFFN